jgi:hypothetical protein
VAGTRSTGFVPSNPTRTIARFGRKFCMRTMASASCCTSSMMPASRNSLGPPSIGARLNPFSARRPFGPTVPDGRDVQIQRLECTAVLCDPPKLEAADPRHRWSEPEHVKVVVVDRNERTRGRIVGDEYVEQSQHRARECERGPAIYFPVSPSSSLGGSPNTNTPRRSSVREIEVVPCGVSLNDVTRNW